MGTITLRNGKKGRSYKAQVRRKGYEAATETFDTKAKAQRWIRATEAEMDAGRFVSRKEAEKTTLLAAFQRYEETVTPHKGGAVQERSVIRKFCAHKLALRSMASLTASDFIALRDEWKNEGLASATIGRRLAVVSNLFTVCRKEWGFAGLYNVLDDVSKPVVRNDRERLVRAGDDLVPHHVGIKGFNDDDGSRGENDDGDDEEPRHRAAIVNEVERIAAVTRSWYLPPAMRFAVETAMRRGEISGLQWANVSLSEGLAYLPKTKNGYPRMVPLSHKARAILVGLPKTSNGRVFPLRADSLTRAFSRALLRARMGYEEQCKGRNEQPDKSFLIGLRFHDLRHEAITRLAKLFQFGELAKITGHRTPKMLMRYYHPNAADFAKRFPIPA